jgi:hypothetical protein
MLEIVGVVVGQSVIPKFVGSGVGQSVIGTLVGWIPPKAVRGEVAVVGFDVCTTVLNELILGRESFVDML